MTKLGKHGLKLMDEDDAKMQVRIDKILLLSRMQLTAVEELGLSVGTYNVVKSFGFDAVADIYYDHRFPSRCDCNVIFELHACLLAHGFPSFPE